MFFDRHLVLFRGAGDLATGAAYRLHKAGFPIIMLELPQPLVVRRRVALATAILEGEVQIEELRGRAVATPDEALQLSAQGIIPVLASPELPASLQPSVLVDARMAKRNLGTSMEQAGTVVALGPGFVAGKDCHAVIETKRGHWLGRVIWQGAALPNTGTPGVVAGKGAERVLRAPLSGLVTWQHAIGDSVQAGEKLGEVAGAPVLAPFSGVVRGLVAPGSIVPEGLKIGDVDARADVEACFTISDKALAVGGGVLEAVISHIRMRSGR